MLSICGLSISHDVAWAWMSEEMASRLKLAIVIMLSVLPLAWCEVNRNRAQPSKPNVVILFADDVSFNAEL